MVLRPPVKLTEIDPLSLSFKLLKIAALPPLLTHRTTDRQQSRPTDRSNDVYIAIKGSAVRLGRRGEKEKGKECGRPSVRRRRRRAAAAAAGV